jgi:DNA-binding CsgD family transcriptional regulator
MRKFKPLSLENECDQYIKLWEGVEFVTDSDISSFAESLKKNPYIGSGATISYLIDYRNISYMYMGPNIVDILGYSYEYLLNGGPLTVLQLIHPDDIKLHVTFSLPRFKDYLKTIPDHELLNIKFNYNYRVRRSDGKYIHLLQQFVVLKKDHYGNPIYNYGTVSDISHMKKDTSIVLQISRFIKETGFMTVVEEKFPGRESPLLTKREIEIISLMSLGLTSKEIADKLFISPKTVLTHKNNMYANTGKHGQLEIIDYARKNGLL